MWSPARNPKVDYEAEANSLAEQKRVLLRFLNASVRGAASGFAIRGGLNLVSILLTLSAKARGKKVKPSRNPEELLHDTLRYAAFLGSLGGLYVAFEEAIAHFVGKERSAHWRAAAAGALCGPTLLITGSETRHTSLSLYILLRGITLLVRCGNKPTSAPLLRCLLSPTRWAHGDTALMCLSTCQLAYSWLFEPQTLPLSYVRFLNKHGGKELYCYAAVKEVCRRNSHGPHPSAPLAALQGTPMQHIHTSLPCDFLHPGQKCTPHSLQFFKEAYLRALPVYLPVYIVPALLVHRQRLLQGPKASELWQKMGIGVARSSLFLSLYCALAWRGSCGGFQASGRSTVPVMIGSCWIAGLATLVEKKSRRMELALYCITRALESFALCLGEWGVLRRDLLPKRIDVLVFSAAIGAIMHCYSDDNGRHRDVFRSKYLNVLDFVFGNSGVESGKISHVPSTGEMLNKIVSSPSVQRLQDALRRQSSSPTTPSLSPPRPSAPNAHLIAEPLSTGTSCASSLGHDSSLAYDSPTRSLDFPLSPSLQMGGALPDAQGPNGGAHDVGPRPKGGGQGPGATDQGDNGV